MITLSLLSLLSSLSIASKKIQIVLPQHFIKGVAKLIKLIRNINKSMLACLCPLAIVILSLFCIK